VGKRFQASTAPDLSQRLMHRTPPPCILASRLEERGTGSWSPRLGGLCTPGSAVYPRVCCAPAFPADLYLSEHNLLSQNPSMVGVGRDLCGSPAQPLLKQGHPQQAAQHRVQAGLEYLQRRRLYNLPGQPVPDRKLSPC